MTFEEWGEELKKAVGTSVYDWGDMYADWEMDHKRLKWLIKALKPFADAADETDAYRNFGDDVSVWKPQSNFRETAGIKVGDLRRARAVLEEVKK